jgi:anaerobic ribonucleoside-triphosphate reductase activating protein
MASELLRDHPEGITVSGGEPTEQWEAVKKLLKECHKRSDDLNVLMFTGLTEEQLVTGGILKESFEECHGSQALISTIVCGPYDRDNPSDNYLLGSTNQKILRWDGVPLLVEDGPRVEIHIERDGKIKVTGFPNRDVIKAIKQNFTKEK